MPKPDPIQSMPDWHLATVTRVCDGDTVHLAASLGLGVEVRPAPARLLGIQAPELVGRDKWAAQQSRQFLSHHTLNQRLYVHAPGDQRDRYGRWLVWLWLPHTWGLQSVNRLMVDRLMAYEWWPKGWGYRAQLPPPWVPWPIIDPHGSG